MRTKLADPGKTGPIPQYGRSEIFRIFPENFQNICISGTFFYKFSKIFPYGRGPTFLVWPLQEFCVYNRTAQFQRAVLTICHHRYSNTFFVLFAECFDCSWACSCGTNDPRRGKVTDGTEWTQGGRYWSNKAGTNQGTHLMHCACVYTVHAIIVCH